MSLPLLNEFELSWWKRSLCLNGMESKPITNHSVIWIHSWIQWRKQPINQQQTSFHQLKESKLSFSLISFHLSLINGMELIKKYYNSKVAYYIHGQYDLLMEEGNWRNQINQLNLNGGCSGCPLNFIHSTFLLFLMGRKVENELKLKGLAAKSEMNWFVCLFFSWFFVG